MTNRGKIFATMIPYEINASELPSLARGPFGHIKSIPLGAAIYQKLFYVCITLKIQFTKLPCMTSSGREISGFISIHLVFHLKFLDLRLVLMV